MGKNISVLSIIGKTVSYILFFFRSMDNSLMLRTKGILNKYP